MSGHVVETTSELSAFMKAGVMACSDRDAGFCSGGDEDDMSGLHSPSASEDSVEVQVTTISLRNKRKLAEPRKIQEQNSAPLKKRRFERIEETVVADEESRPAESPSPFRPWSTSSKSNESKSLSIPPTIIPIGTATSSSSISTIASSTATTAPSQEQKDEEEQRRREQEEARRRHEARIQQEVLMRLHESNRRAESPETTRSTIPRREPRQRFEPPAAPPPLALSSTTTHSAPLLLTHPRLQEEPLSLVLRGEIPRVPSHPAVSGSYERLGSSSYGIEQQVHPGSHQDQQHPHHPPTAPHHHHHHQQNHHQPIAQTAEHSKHQQQSINDSSGGGGGGSSSGQQRNYKNMTRERRIEANARERTRVHTISAAFDTLRRAIPAYSHNQKLSKLSVLRIACSYIMTLSKIANTPEGEPTTSASLGACVDLVSRTIQTEGKLRKRKDE